MSGTYPRIQRLGATVVILTLLVTLAASTLRAQGEVGSETSSTSQDEPVFIRADFSQEWQSEGAPIWILRGRCQIVQGDQTLSSQKMVVWKQPESEDGESSHRLIVFLEGDAHIEQTGSTVSESSFLTELASSETTFEVRHRVTDQSGEQDALFERAAAHRKRLAHRPRPKGRNLVQTQMLVPATRRVVRIYPRYFQKPFAFESFQSLQTTPPEQVIVLTRGVNVLIDGVEPLGTLDISADRIVIWTDPGILGDAQDLQLESVQTRDTPLQIYMEGNIVIRQGERVVTASQAFYDMREYRGIAVNSQLRTFIPELGTEIRLRAEQLRQTSVDSFHAHQGWITTSQMGKPGYRLQASDIFYEERVPNPWVIPHPDAIDPMTGAPLVEPVPWVTSLNNTFLIDDFPLLYLPYLSGPANDPNIPLRRIAVGNDRVFGAQVRTTWNLVKLLGLDASSGLLWDLDLDYLSDRGPGVGTTAEYEGIDLFGLGDIYYGNTLGYYIHDDGHDNLGRDRRDLVPSTKDRYRVLARHRHLFPYNMTLTGELSPISDRNFLEQYYENEFDEAKDQETLVHLKQQEENWAWSIMGQARLNDFEYKTDWYPRGDLYALGEPLLGGLLNWSTHTSAGLADLKTAQPPYNPTQDIFTPIPYFADVGGALLMTRHELDAPFYLGPVIVDPYVMGEAAYWSEDLNGDSLDRLYGRAGIRSSVMFWKVLPWVHSHILNLNGLAHKMVFSLDYAFSDSSENLADIAQYNQIDDDAQERFRERLVTNTFGGMLPDTFESRFYGVRTGAGASVTAPYHELVDDQQVLRVGWRQRLQTKVGPPHQLRIKDWMTLDTAFSYYPDADRDNFGEDIGLATAHYGWNVGDRTKLLANAQYDFFDDAQQLWDVGILSQRSERGSVYVSVRQIKGATLDSQILTSSYSYVMSPKWISTFGSAYDLAEGEDRGQSLTLTRVGADFLIHFGANYDASKDNVGIALAIEPRFGLLGASPTNLSSLLGIR